MGCTDEIDGPYLVTSTSGTYAPVYDDAGEITGLVGTLIINDELTDEGKEAGCPADLDATYSYVAVAAPSDGIEGGEKWSVDGTFRESREITQSEGYRSEVMQVGVTATTLEGHDIDLTGDCDLDECTVAYHSVDGDDQPVAFDLTADDGLTLTGSHESINGCADPTTGERIMDDGAYASTLEYESLIPVWIEDGKAVAFVGQLKHQSEPTSAGAAEPECSAGSSFASWVYLIDLETFEGV